jgi:hypothetical protein
MHENVVRGNSSGGGKTLWQWQGNSLFGMEKFGDPPTIDRRHGYSAGIISFGSFGPESLSLRHWPRKLIRDVNGSRFVPDSDTAVLQGDGGTPRAELRTPAWDNAVAARSTLLDKLSRLPPQLLTAVDDLGEASFLYQRRMTYQIDLVEDDTKGVWLRIEFTQDLFNAADVAIDKTSSFPIFSKKYRKLEASINDKPYNLYDQPEALARDGPRLSTRIPPGSGQRIRFAAEVKYARTDSELFLTYQLCERFSLRFFDHVSKGQGVEAYEVLPQPLHLKRGVMGQARRTPDKFGFEIEIDSGLLPYHGVQLQWKPAKTKK